jgi:hypothetical protein
MSIANVVAGPSRFSGSLGERGPQTGGYFPSSNPSSRTFTILRFSRRTWTQNRSVLTFFLLPFHPLFIICVIQISLLLHLLGAHTGTSYVCVNATNKTRKDNDDKGNITLLGIRLIPMVLYVFVCRPSFPLLRFFLSCVICEYKHDCA